MSSTKFSTDPEAKIKPSSGGDEKQTATGLSPLVVEMRSRQQLSPPTPNLVKQTKTHL
jgi:hypothetical protein